MLERVLANVLTNILGQYLLGIDRNSVSFGAWSGLVELRGVALRAEALAVLFETLGMDLPVTVEAGFIGLLRLTVPWKSIGSTPVKIELEGINIIARPVRDDGSDDSEIAVRERRIKRAKLMTDDAVREASWNMTDNSGAKRNSTLSWFVSDDMLAKIVANIQIELRDLVLRFEDPYSNNMKPYGVAIRCKTLKAVSANEDWEQVFIENVASPRTRKLVIVDGFEMEWFPIDMDDGRSSSSRNVQTEGKDEGRYQTAEELQNFFASEQNNSPSNNAANPVQLISPISGSLRLDLSQAEDSMLEQLDIENLPEARALVDIRFPDIAMYLDEVQYASLVQTSLYFSKLNIRGYNPKTPKERWVWAVEQLLPGFRARRAMEYAFSNEGIAERRKDRLKYIECRVELLKSRRSSAEASVDINEELEKFEDTMVYDRIIRYRDLADEECLEASKEWTAPSPPAATARGTTMSSLWNMLGYEQAAAEEAADSQDSTPSIEEKGECAEAGMSIDEEAKVAEGPAVERKQSAGQSSDMKQVLSRIPTAQVSFHLRRGSIQLIQGGYPNVRTPIVDLVMTDLVVGAKRFELDGFLMEVLLGSVEVWELRNTVRLVYSRIPRNMASVEAEVAERQTSSSYPVGVPNALQAIRSGFEANCLPLANEEVEEHHSESEAQAEEISADFETDVDRDGIYTTENQSKQNFSEWPNFSTVPTANQGTTHRVTNEEFFGKGHDEGLSSLPYIAAVQIFKKQADKTGKTAQRKQTQVVAAVGQLEAVVDGPKGSFLWALKFWKPKGLKKDPIIALLGAAAGARIAELRMELEEAVLADRIPLLIDALIRAPRFVIPGKSTDHPAIVVNMGTLGIRTSEKEAQSRVVSSLTRQSHIGNYSNYALSLDDLGMYIAPNEKIATSASRTLQEESVLSLEPDTDSTPDVKSVERLIRPLSMRFIVQVLRDASSVHAASQSIDRGLHDDRISRLRLRGEIPGLWLVLSQKACRHITGTAKRWSKEALAPSRSLEQATKEMTELPPLLPLDSKDISHHPRKVTELASYDCRVGVEHVSLELQDQHGHRLVTMVTSGMRASVVKTKHLSLDSEFTLKSWTVTDGSRGSTAPFRRLVYAGTGSGVRGVSPPRSSSSSSRRSKSESLSETPTSDTNFVNIKHKLKFSNGEQAVNVHFLSLNLIFVRETVLKIASFFEGVRGSDPLFMQGPALGHDRSLNTGDTIDQSKTIDALSPSARKRILLTAMFDGFHVEFVSAEGSVSSIEMRDFAFSSSRCSNGDIEASGDVRYFSIDDLTASIREHRSLVHYEKPNVVEMESVQADEKEKSPATSLDGWELLFPKDPSGEVSFKTRLRGLRIRYLSRFISVMNGYFSALSLALRDSKLITPNEASVLLEQGQEKTTALLASKTRSYNFEVKTADVKMILPRHSGNADEALIFNVPSVNIDNHSQPAPGYKSRIRILFSDLQASTQYRVEESGRGSFLSESIFLEKHNADLELDVADFATYTSNSNETPGSSRTTAPFVQARFNIQEEAVVQLCEAQYSVLYFVLTENLIERIEEGAMSLRSSDMTAKKEDNVSPTTSKKEGEFGNIDPSNINDDKVAQMKVPLVSVAFRIPHFIGVVSRGWNIKDSSCHLLELRNRNICGNVDYSQTEMLVEFNTSVVALTDLREDHSVGTRTFALPLEPLNTSGEHEETHNFSLAFSKVFGNRPSIEINLFNMLMKVNPEFLRDISYLSIPGWPFLPLSDFAPACAYLGRTMAISVSNSQVLLYADEFADDSRGLVLSGKFLARLEFVRGTGAKIFSLRTTGLEVALENSLEHMKFNPESDPEECIAKRYSDLDSLILYPSDSNIEYFGPKVDELGARARVDSDSILCRINVQDAPSVFAALRRLTRLNKSYLSRRAWKQPSLEDQARALGLSTAADPVDKMKADHAKTMNVAYSTPAARLLLTNESGGRFIPILELNAESIKLEGTVPSLAHIEMEVSINLFSREKGWWEPGLEYWKFEASLSRGASGTKAFVIKSETALNINVTPDTIKAAKEVTVSLRSIKAKADSYLETHKNNSGGAGKAKKIKSKSGPSVAAFHVYNALGLPVEVFVPASAERSTLIHLNELEVHMPVEQLLPSYRSNNQLNDNMRRHNTLRCQISIPGYSPLDLSAAEVGCHSVTFHSFDDDTPGSSSQKNARREKPVFAVWEIAMVQGVPLCTIRSPVQIVNRTDKTLQLSFRSTPIGAGQMSHLAIPRLTLLDEDVEQTIGPGAHFCVPLIAVERLIRVRPARNQKERNVITGETLDGVLDFEWCDPVNGWEWLKMANTAEPVKQHRLGRGTSAKEARAKKYAIEHEIVRCRSLNSLGSDFFLAVVPESYSQGITAHGSRLDIALQAPLSFTNKLPGRISYRVSEASSADRIWDWNDSNCTILGSDVVSPHESAFIYCTDDTQNLSGISVAFENSPVEIPGLSLSTIDEGRNEGVPTRFGPFISLSSILSGQATLLPTRESSSPRIAKSEMGSVIHVVSGGTRIPSFNLYAPFWLRNRSDVDLDVTSRGSFYGKGSSIVRFRGHPKGQPAGRFLCFDGPYLAVRCYGEVPSSSQNPNQWWVCPTDLRDVSAPVPMTIPNKSLLVDVRPGRGIDSSSFVVTVRNAAFIINNTDRCIQWCQTFALDAQGNCPFRHLKFLKPQEEVPIHWAGAKNNLRINVRLANEKGESDWLWSPSLPLLLGNAGEVSAKMYRPKTNEQYISRVQSSKLDGGAVALMVLSEDRSNPPYRIVNMCKTRSVAFRQIGTAERPWLVRPGRSTRYSWDDPMAPGSARKLQIDLLDEASGMSSARTSRPGPSSLPPPSSKAPPPNIEVNIDIVNDKFQPVGDLLIGVSYSVAMESATKVIVFRDTDDTSEVNMPLSSAKSEDPNPEVPEEPAAPVVHWDDFKESTSILPNSEGISEDKGDSSEQSEVMIPYLSTSDYPLKTKTTPLSARIGSISMDTDAAFYLASVGVSLVTSDPVELLYLSASGLKINFEAYDSLQCLYFQVKDLQVDNQLDNPPFPVALWANAPVFGSNPGGEQTEEVEQRTLAFEVKRIVSDNGILMLKSLRAAVQPLNLRIDEELVSRVIEYVNEITALSRSRKTEILESHDGEEKTILVQLMEKNKASGKSPMKQIKQSFKSAERLYVEDLKLYDAQIILTSSVARGNSSRKLTHSAALRPLMAFLMNVENCEFSFSPLEVKHLFSSRNHFISLIRQFYESQLSGQKMKLLTSNSLVGNPAALFDSVALGAKDFFSEPGRAKGSGDFLVGFGRGSKSLITHTVGGIVGSISGIPKAVSSGLESAVGDEHYLAERERIRGTQLSGGRRNASSNPAQGVVTGALSFAHGISSGVTGLFKDPVQGAMQGGASGFLKGVRKGLVGGVVKPVTGAIDLISEPVSGLSKAMNEGDKQHLRHVASKRPPRTFWGQSNRLVAFDLRAATGFALYRAVQINSGVSFPSELIDWVELSDREARKDANGSEWVWGVVRERVRAMARPRRGTKSERVNTQENNQDVALQLRPEKTRVALLTFENILIVTLDCKLLLTIPLWDDANFSVEGYGKDLVLTTQMDIEASRSSGSSIISETQALFAAPWDASSSARRRKPNPGELVRDKIACGSIAAREDLCQAIINLLEAKQKKDLRNYAWGPTLRRPPSAIELPVLQGAGHGDDADSRELSQTRRSDASDGSAGVFVMPMSSPMQRTEVGAGTDGSGLEAKVRAEEKAEKKRNVRLLDGAIRRLSMSGTKRAIDSKRSIRMIVTNEVGNGCALTLVRSSLDRGYWRSNVAGKIEAFEAVMFEVDSGSVEEIKRMRQKGGREVSGSMTFRVSGKMHSTNDGTASGTGYAQVDLEFNNGSSSSPKYATRGTGGLAAVFESGSGNHATVLFRITESTGEDAGRSSIRSSPPATSSRGSLMKRAGGKLMGLTGRSSSWHSSPGLAGRPGRSGMGSTVVDETSVAKIVELGFTAEAATGALQAVDNDLLEAINLLTK